MSGMYNPIRNQLDHDVAQELIALGLGREDPPRGEGARGYL